MFDKTIGEEILSILQGKIERGDLKKVTKLLNREQQLIDASWEEAQQQLEKIASDRLSVKQEKLEHEKKLVEDKNKYAIEFQKLFDEQVTTRLDQIKNEEENLKGLIKEHVSQIEEIVDRKKEIVPQIIELKKLTSNAESGFLNELEELIRELDSRQAGHQSKIEKLRDKEDAIKSDEEKLALERQELLEKKKVVDAKFKEAEAGFSKQKEELEGELSGVRRGRLDELDDLIAKERRSKQDDLKKEIEEDRDAARSRLKADIEAHRQDREQLKEKLKSVDLQSSKLDLKEQQLDALEHLFDQREAGLDKEVDRRFQERERTYSMQLKQSEDEAQRLRDSLESRSDLLAAYKQLEQECEGGSPQILIAQLTAHTEHIADLEKKLLDRPTQEMQDKYDQFQSEKSALNARLKEYKERNEQLELRSKGDNEYLRQISELKSESTSLHSQISALDATRVLQEQQLKKFRDEYTRDTDKDRRMKDVENPPLFNEGDLLGRRKGESPDEHEWLQGIQDKMGEAGFVFADRLLKAFHTSLKISEWSPITVLAGVSGTGKSELPRLYSRFGGINFMPVAVQPNWDSQESMLGYFNSLDDEFVAEPLLRFLAQTQIDRIKRPEYPGLSDCVNLVLLDEMNLAHIELYFANFLSKLETRRGMAEVPDIEVSLGSGEFKYPLPLGRNVLWAGTMNQDETTKSLSDKVIDRGTIMYFPRPTKLVRRETLEQLDSEKFDPAGLLLHKHWKNWLTGSFAGTFAEEEIKPYKDFVEEMNKNLSRVGRSLGHRVWQSIERYMNCHPDVTKSRQDEPEKLEAAMKRAFEDQLVQKVMPKLRGIETRGESKTHCLDLIQAQLVDGGYSIVDDFVLATKLGYGQFMWCSANYLSPEESAPDPSISQTSTPDSPEDSVGSDEAVDSTENATEIEQTPDEELMIINYEDEEKVTCNDLAERLSEEPKSVLETGQDLGLPLKTVRSPMSGLEANKIIDWYCSSDE